MTGGRGSCPLPHPLRPSCLAMQPSGVPAPHPRAHPQDKPSTCTCAPTLAPPSAGTSVTAGKLQGAPAELELSGFPMPLRSGGDFGPLGFPPLSAYHSLSLLSLLCFEQKFQNKAQSAQWPRRKTWTQHPEANVQW